MPDTYLRSTPADILHKLWHSNLVPNNITTATVWPAIWQQTIYYDLLPIQKVLSPNYYNRETNKVAITAPYSHDSDQSDFTPLLPATRCMIPSKLTIIKCSLHIRRPNMIMMTEIPPSSTMNATPTDLSQSDWYYAPKSQQEHLRTDLLPFHWYTGQQNTPTQSTTALPKYYTDHSIRRSARGSLIYSVAPAPTAITTTAYLPALATIFQIGPEAWITWTYGKHHTETPLPLTPDKNLLQPP